MDGVARAPRRRVGAPQDAGAGGHHAGDRRHAGARRARPARCAGKVCGAGGGGCLFCLADPDRRSGCRDGALRPRRAHPAVHHSNAQGASARAGAHGSADRNQEALLQHHEVTIQKDFARAIELLKSLAQRRSPPRPRSTWKGWRRCGRSGDSERTNRSVSRVSPTMAVGARLPAARARPRRPGPVR